MLRVSTPNILMKNSETDNVTFFAELETALINALAHINQLPEEKRAQWRRAILYISLLILHRRPSEEHDDLNTLVEDQIRDESRKKEANEMSQSMAEKTFQQGEARGERRGERRGIEIGEKRGIEIGERRGEKRGALRAKRQATLTLLQLRFDNVPDALIRKINAMRSIARLDAIYEKVALAPTLEDIDPENL